MRWHRHQRHVQSTNQDAACSQAYGGALLGGAALSVWRAWRHVTAPVAVSHQALLQLPVLCEGHHELRRPCGSNKDFITF